MVDNSAAASKILKEQGLSVVETPVRLLALPDKIGALAEMAERLSKRKVNINFVYGSAGQGKTAVMVLDAKSAR